MSEPESESKQLKPVPASAPAPVEEQEFDLLAFWIQYRNTIIRSLVLILVGVAVYFGYEFTQQRKLADSATALASAKNADELSKVTADWAGTPAAASAQLRLGEELRRAGKYDESAKALQEFAAKYPKHQLQDRALISLGISQEFAGKPDEAYATYQRVVSDYSTSSAASDAQIRQARILKAKGKTEEALRILAALEQQAKTPFYLDEIRALTADIKNPNGRMTGGNPRPVQPEPADAEKKPEAGKIKAPAIAPAPAVTPAAAPENKPEAGNAPAVPPTPAPAPVESQAPNTPAPVK
jgi:TolA-binding protein